MVTAKSVEERLGVTPKTANALISSLVDIGILRLGRSKGEVEPNYIADDVMKILTTE